MMEIAEFLICIWERAIITSGNDILLAQKESGSCLNACMVKQAEV